MISSLKQNYFTICRTVHTSFPISRRTFHNGFSTLLNKIFDKYPGLCSFSVSYTTRAPREGEQNGREYHFVSVEEFQSMIDEDGFIEYCEVHSSKYYGTAVKELERIKNESKVPVLDIDVQGATKVHNKQIDSVFIFILPCKDVLKPTDSTSEMTLSEEQIEKVTSVLRERLEGRGTETKEQINDRLTNSIKEIESYYSSSFFTHSIVNEDLSVSCLFIYISLDCNRRSIQNSRVRIQRRNQCKLIRLKKR